MKKKLRKKHEPHDQFKVHQNKPSNPNKAITELELEKQKKKLDQLLVRDFQRDSKLMCENIIYYYNKHNNTLFARIGFAID